MDTSNKWSHLIMGEVTLPMHCSEILLKRLPTFYGVISPDVAVHARAQEKEIPHIDPKNKSIVTFLSQRSFDYLFNIVITYILLLDAWSRYPTV
jgi:hypothetical protein